MQIFVAVSISLENIFSHDTLYESIINKYMALLPFIQQKKLHAFHFYILYLPF